MSASGVDWDTQPCRLLCPGMGHGTTGARATRCRPAADMCVVPPPSHRACRPALTRARHRHAARETLEAVERAIQHLQRAAPLELSAEDLRVAAHALGRITGKVDIEELLDAIFREFCLGK